jgi:hypothetical protein
MNHLTHSRTWLIKPSLALVLGLGLVLSAFGQAAQQASSHAEQVKNLGLARYGTGLGRLLTTERERAKIDDIRFSVVAQIKAEKKEATEGGSKLLHIDGVSYRPDRPAGQRISVWINGRVYVENALPQGISLVRNAQGEVIGLNSLVSKGKTEFAKIGDDITRPQTAAEAQAIELERAAAQSKKPTEQP